MRELSEAELALVSGGQAVVEDWSPHPMSEEDRALEQIPITRAHILRP